MRRQTRTASAARHQLDRQPSKRMPNFGSWAGRLHAVLGAMLFSYLGLNDQFASFQMDKVN